MTDIIITPSKGLPLGLLESHSHSKDSKVISILEFIENFDMTREIGLLEKSTELKLPKKYIPTIEREFKRFMSLRILFGPGIYAPTPPIDYIWHELIIDTQRYFEFCNTVFGEYLHHCPLSPTQIAEFSGEVLFQTKQRLSEAYGHIVPAIWGEISAGCDYRACVEGCIGPWK